MVESHIKSVRSSAIFQLPGANGKALKQKLSPDWPTHCCRAVLFTVQLRCDKRPFVVGLFTHCAVVGMDYMSACMSCDGSPVVVGLSRVHTLCSCRY